MLWGLLPGWFVLLAPMPAVEVVPWRVFFSVGFSGLMLTAMRAWHPALAAFRDRRTLQWLAAAAVVIYINWQTFAFGVMSGRVVEASLGYFINPLFTVVLGVLIYRERLRPLQWTSVAIGAIAVAVLTAAYGRVPWIALVLTATFGSYSLVKKIVGPRVEATIGLALESALLVPVALVQLFVVGANSGLLFGRLGVGHVLLIALGGALTVVPLILFAAAARRLPLVQIGFLQYLAPVLQFLMGWLVLGEHMPRVRWIGFGLVWTALLLLITDTVIASRNASHDSAQGRNPETR